jgi:urease accessory protein
MNTDAIAVRDGRPVVLTDCLAGKGIAELAAALEGYRA